MKRFLALLLALVTVFSFVGCNNTEEQPTEPTPTEQQKIDVSVAVLSGPTGMGAAGLMQDAADGKTANNYAFTVASAPDELTGSLLNGEYQIACVPTNLAAVLYNKSNGGFRVAAVNTLGVLYLLANEEVASVADLRGKTIYATNQGSTPEYILRYILAGNNIDPDKDVTIVFDEADTVSAGLASGDITYGMLPEPKITATLAAGVNVKRALNMTEEWKKIDADSDVMQGCIIVNSTFASEHPDAVNAFLDEYKASVQLCADDVDTASALCETHKILPKAAVAKKAYPNCNITYVDGEQMRTSLTAFLQVLYEANPKSVGGKMPGDGFYYAR